MCTAQRCPVCEGRGTICLPDPFYPGTTCDTYADCHGCGRLGWVAVPCNPVPWGEVILTIDGERVPIDAFESVFTPDTFDGRED